MGSEAGKKGPETALGLSWACAGLRAEIIQEDDVLHAESVCLIVCLCHVKRGDECCHRCRLDLDQFGIIVPSCDQGIMYLHATAG